jgi:hypothetical protein
LSIVEVTPPGLAMPTWKPAFERLVHHDEFLGPHARFVDGAVRAGPPVRRRKNDQHIGHLSSP